MPRIVVVPATPLLVPGAAGSTDVLSGVRALVTDVLRRELAAAGAVAVVGAGPTARAGRLRPTLADAGIADRLVPSLARLDDAGTPWEGRAATGASAALLALAAAGLDPAAHAVDVVELPAEAAPGDVRAAAARLARAADGLIVVADRPAPGVDAVVETLTAVGRWSTDVTDLPQQGEHLPASYRVTVHHLG
ncbi:hypothetical protein Xcel_1251 [Xylanimonas cellulosilytica DSM 15894]|uniref:Uncharacterized protein n=1 Tax=Xylanimonas cellulosilytica (strain DSM 15894 / JCM 12276 / CECT 5975 / KCTC 9989 / LMG 20990 / NBRC 107835 / XIL07) TaxID=446471 RepID=D1C093_XYLCX|nr:hypothetical protein [Xylanimonas cellulosilytica]ACZ30282.1 hypothetical protein Xcel_1251 [Xylanimonas cellulosilytica DSM 15894]